MWKSNSGRCKPGKKWTNLSCLLPHQRRPNQMTTSLEGAKIKMPAPASYFLHLKVVWWDKQWQEALEALPNESTYLGYFPLWILIEWRVFPRWSSNEVHVGSKALILLLLWLKETDREHILLFFFNYLLSFPSFTLEPMERGTLKDNHTTDRVKLSIKTEKWIQKRQALDWSLFWNWEDRF